MYSKSACRAASRVGGTGSPAKSSVLSELKKLSAGALSQQLPRRLMLTAIPRTASSCRYIRLEVELPRFRGHHAPFLGEEEFTMPRSRPPYPPEFRRQMI